MKFDREKYTVEHAITVFLNFIGSYCALFYEIKVF